MSVAASLDEGSDPEALARAQRAHEPSMEEILASIRAIIADEREQGGAKPGPQIVYSSDAAPPRAEAAPAAPSVVWSREEEGEAAPAKAEAREETPAEPAPAPEAPARPAVARPAALRAERLAARLPPEPERRPSETAGLVSPVAERAVSQSFQSLAERMSAHGVEVASEMAREMMQPMLKAWLDENLPAIVDRLVKAEIERLTAGWR